MTDIYLMRHGEAIAGRNMPDAARSLTAQGYEAIGRQARLLAEKQPPIAKILHSPYVRAEQTALIVNEILLAEIHSCPSLIPLGSVDQALMLMVGEKKPLLLVTHLPFVAELARTLCDRSLTFFEGTIAMITREDAYAMQGQLAWTAHV